MLLQVNKTKRGLATLPVERKWLWCEHLFWSKKNFWANRSCGVEGVTERVHAAVKKATGSESLLLCRKASGVSFCCGAVRDAERAFAADHKGSPRRPLLQRKWSRKPSLLHNNSQFWYNVGKKKIVLKSTFRPGYLARVTACFASCQKGKMVISLTANR